MDYIYRYILSALVCTSLLVGCGPITKTREKPAPALPELQEKRIVVKTDDKSIQEGRILFAQKCESCHDPDSETKRVGPGLRRVLKNPVLPASGRPATPENVARQMRHPASVMPSFTYLTDEEVENLIAYLNTL